ncbi:hypothetical protein Tco_0797377 [Tanacetum coccineum]
MPRYPYSASDPILGVVMLLKLKSEPDSCTTPRDDSEDYRVTAEADSIRWNEISFISDNFIVKKGRCKGGLEKYLNSPFDFLLDNGTSSSLGNHR